MTSERKLTLLKNLFIFRHAFFRATLARFRQTRKSENKPEDKYSGGPVRCPDATSPVLCTALSWWCKFQTLPRRQRQPNERLNYIDEVFNRLENLETGNSVENAASSRPVPARFNKSGGVFFPSNVPMLVTS